MIEFNALVTADAFRVFTAERDLNARKLARKRELRDLQAADRAQPRERNVIVCKPAHLAGIHKL